MSFATLCRIRGILIITGLVITLIGLLFPTVIFPFAVTGTVYSPPIIYSLTAQPNPAKPGDTVAFIVDFTSYYGVPSVELSGGWLTSPIQMEIMSSGDYDYLYSADLTVPTTATGTYTFTVTVTDNKGGTATATTTISIDTTAEKWIFEFIQPQNDFSMVANNNLNIKFKVYYEGTTPPPEPEGGWASVTLSVTKDKSATEGGQVYWSINPFTSEPANNTILEYSPLIGTDFLEGKPSRIIVVELWSGQDVPLASVVGGSQTPLTMEQSSLIVTIIGAIITLLGIATYIAPTCKIR